VTGNRWRSPDLSTDSTDAAAHYREGIAALVAGAAHADAHFRAAVVADPCFALAHVGLAVAAPGTPVDPPTVGMSRGERHHVETACVWLRGDSRRGCDLRREHLLEFPGDLLIVVLPLVLPPIAPS